jgi:Peptidase inhibitor family I36
MKRAPRLLAAIGVTVAALTAGAAMASTPAYAGSQATREAVSSLSEPAQPVSQAAATTAAIPQGAYTNCPNKYWCLYSGLSGSGLCWHSLATVRYLSDYFCRNEDASFANRTPGLIRLYYSPNLSGDWVCVNSGWYSNNLFNDFYKFNNGTSGTAGGAGELIWMNVASVEVASGKCSNPLPEEG